MDKHKPEVPNQVAPSGAAVELGLVAHNGDLVRVRQLLRQGVDPNTVGWAGRTALMNALSPVIGPPSKISGASSPDPRVLKRDARKRDISQFLLAQGADPNLVTPDGLAALHYAVTGPGDERELVPIVRGLLRRGARVDARTSHAVTPLLMALEYKRPTLARLLLDAGADPRAVDKGGDTPESVAVKHGLKEVLAYIREKAARP